MSSSVKLVCPALVVACPCEVCAESITLSRGDRRADGVRSPGVKGPLVWMVSGAGAVTEVAAR